MSETASQEYLRIPARDREAALIFRCTLIAKGDLDVLLGSIEANASKLAGIVLRSTFPSESSRLRAASLTYFSQFPDAELSPQEVVDRGWLTSLPRPRDLLEEALTESL